MSDELNDIPSNSMRAREEKETEKNTERPGITPRKKGIGSFFRQMVNRGDVDSVTNIFANAMINAVGDTIDEVTGNLTHRAKSILYGTEDYDRGRTSRRGGDRYNSYSKYYEERNGRNRPTGSSGNRNTNRNDDSDNRSSKKWKYNDVFFSAQVFGGKRGAELAAWRVIKAMDEQISDPDVECVSVADFFRYCKEEDPQNPMLVPEFTDERWGWTDEDVISRLQPIAVPGGYIIELPKPKSFYN
ncbi:MAG: hypothetical protein IKD62_02325 [Oscillospiraceae bacterium]|nr:hypothetical protein [Oscillospiraceae bacterium]MBR3585488.1 hypothetical protein [Oscillospiraceae bacterium]